jgi:hypothetical protein
MAMTGRYLIFPIISHNFQLTEAFHPVIRYIDDSFVIELDIENYTIDKNNVYMIVYSPNSLKPNTYVLSRFVPLIDDKQLVVNLGSFKVTHFGCCLEIIILVCWVL